MLNVLFQNCFDILRVDGIVGGVALRDISLLLTLKLLEPHIGRDLDFVNFNYTLGNVSVEEINKIKTVLLKNVYFSNLVKEKNVEFLEMIKNLWTGILSQHPSTKQIFPPNDTLKINKNSTLTKLIERLAAADLSNIEHDILGSAYEKVFQDVMIGKVLGQFFTPTPVKKLMVDLINPQIQLNGQIESCCDPTMGTGGFLITYLSRIMAQAKEKNVALDWDFIKKSIYGKELNQETYQLAMANMLISTGHIFEQIEHGDSLIEPITRKFDNILANPPFGIKGIVYDAIAKNSPAGYAPIYTNNAILLFLQAIIYMLKPNGKCAVVIPTGNVMFVKTAEFVNVREYLMKTCDIQEIIYMSSVFENTAIKTCIFYFIKRCEGNTILKVTKNTKNTKTHTDNIYTFAPTHQTNIIRYSQYDFAKNQKTLLGEISINELIKNSYSLDYNEYITQVDKLYKPIVDIQIIDDTCDLTRGKPIKNGRSKDEIYPVYGAGDMIYRTDTYNREGKTCKISRAGMSLHNCVMILNEQYYLNESFTIKSKNPMLLDGYLWIYLYNNRYLVFNCGRGAAQVCLCSEQFKNLKIPIPPLEIQQFVINYTEFLAEKRKKMMIEYNKICNVEFYLLPSLLLNNVSHISDALGKPIDDFDPQVYEELQNKLIKEMKQNEPETQQIKNNNIEVKKIFTELYNKLDDLTNSLNELMANILKELILNKESKTINEIINYLLNESSDINYNSGY